MMGGGREGGSWHSTQSHRYGDGAVYPAPILYGPTAEPIYAERRGEGEEKERAVKTTEGRGKN